MDSFTFHNPTTIEFGHDKERQIGQLLAQHGIKRVLLCYGSERIKRDGLFSTVEQSLNAEGITFVTCGGIVSNPLLSKAREAIEIAREAKVDAVLSVGGGSVLDCAKAIATGVCYAGDVWDLFIGKGVIERALPIFSILTLAATGSEMNSYAVLTNEATKEKLAIGSPHVFPRVSIVNPVLMKSVSRDYLVYSAADIIAHCIEGYFTATTQPHFQSRIVEAIIHTVIETTEILLENPEDYLARAEFAWAATQALNGLIYAGTAGFSYPNHAIEHSLSALFNVPHGGGLSVIMPAWMRWYHTQNEAQFERFATQVFGLQAADGAESLALRGIAALEAWFNKIGTPTRLSQFNIQASDVPAIVENAVVNAKYFGLPDSYTADMLNDLLQQALV